MKMILSWSYPADQTCDEFVLYRRVGLTNYTALAHVPYVAYQSAFSYDDTTVVYGTTYDYVITAKGPGGESTLVVRAVNTMTLPAPVAPSNFTATPAA